MAKLERLLRKARAQHKKGRSNKALDLFREACDEAPHDPDVWLERAGVAESLEGKDEAVEALFHAADLYARAGLSSEAAEIAERVLEMNPKHGGAKRFVRMMRGRGRPGKVEARAKGKGKKRAGTQEKVVKEEALEKPEAAGKSVAEAPTEEKAPKEKPAKEKPSKEKPAEEKAVASKAEKEKPAKEKPAKEKPTDEEPAAEKPPEGKPAEEKAPKEKPAKEKPAEEKASEEKAAAAKAAEESAAEEKVAKERPAEEKPSTAAEAVERAAAKTVDRGASAEEDEEDDGVEIDVDDEDYAAVSIEKRQPEAVWTPSLTAGMQPDSVPEERGAVDAALRAKARAGARSRPEVAKPVEHRMGRVTGEIALGDLSLAAMLDEAEANAAAEFPLDDEDDIKLVQAVAATVTSSPLLSELDSDLVKYLIDCGRVMRTLRGKAVFMEGESGTSLYLILEGSVDVERGDPDTGRVRRLASLRRGAFFGEMALITDAPRSATVRAKRDTTLLEVSRESVLGLVKRENRVLKLLMRFFRARLVGNLLATSPLFQDFDIEARRQIVRLFRLRELPGGYEVLQKDQRSDGLYLVLAGDLVAFLPELEGGEQLLGELGPGDVFGEMSLLEGTTAMASIRAVVRSWVLRLPREDFARLVAEHPLLLEQLAEIAESRRQANIETLRSASVRPV